MNLKAQRRLAKIIFWIGQVVGSAMILLLILFIGGNLIGELIDPNIDTNFKEDYSVFILFFCEILVAVTIVISWKKSKPGAYLMLALLVLICIIWGREDLNVILLHVPLFFSGLLILFYAYYKERIEEKEGRESSA